MSLWSKIRGTIETYFQLGLSGPQLKNNSGAVDHRDSTDAVYVNVRGADPLIADDLVTKRYGDANYTAGGGNLNAPGSFTVVTGNYKIIAVRLTLTGTQRATLQGTAHLRLV